MRVPSAIRDFGREFDQGNYLGFTLGARRLLQAAGSLPALEESLKVMEGWADLADASVEGDRPEPPDEETDLYFSRARTLKALTQVTRAFDALGDGNQLQLEGDPQAEEKGSALSHLDGVKGFLAEFASHVGKLDEVRIPAWQARWTGQRPVLLPIDLSALNPPLTPGEFELSAPRADTQLLTLTRKGQPAWSLETNAKALTATLTQVTEFTPPGEVPDEDRETLMYEWVDEQLQAMKPRPPRGLVMSCSFCGKAQNQVKKIIAGPTSYICDECVALCNDIINEEPHGQSGA